MRERIAVDNWRSKFARTPKLCLDKMTEGTELSEETDSCSIMKFLDLVFLFLREICVCLSSIGKVRRGSTGTWVAVREEKGSFWPLLMI